MDRTTLLLIVIAGTAAWMLYKRFVKKEPLKRDPYRPPVPAVENWYTDTMALIEALDEETRKKREDEWDQKSAEEQLEFAVKFMFDRFGQEAVDSYTRKQRIKIGMAQYVAVTTPEPDNSEEETSTD